MKRGWTFYDFGATVIIIVALIGFFVAHEASHATRDAWAKSKTQASAPAEAAQPRAAAIESLPEAPAQMLEAAVEK